jgi:hypothetical protein
LPFWRRTEAEERSRGIRKPLHSALLPSCDCLYSPATSITRARNLRHQARTGRARCVSRALSSAVHAHEPCGQDHSITCRFDRGSTPRTWLEHRDRATDAREQQRTQGDQNCPADNRSSRQRSEAGALGLQAWPSGGKSRGFEPLAAQQEEHCWHRSLRSLPQSPAV